MKLTLEPRTKYGHLYYYPMCETSRALVTLNRDKRSKQKVLLKREVEMLKRIGFEVDLIPYLDPNA